MLEAINDIVANTSFSAPETDDITVVGLEIS